MDNNKKKLTVNIDANAAAGYVGYALSDLQCIYPISPSSAMAEQCDEMANKGEKNVFGNLVKVVQLQSEAGAAGALHGSLVAGSLTTTFTASQGLLLMIPNMYKLAGEMLPAVFHVTARTIATHALSIFGDHSDVMACRQTGFCMIGSANVQEAMDLAVISHISAMKASLPFLHFFDGWRTSHEINKIEKVSYDVMKQMLPLKEIEAFRKRAHNPENPKQTGTAQNADIHFQNREACNTAYKNAYGIIESTMKEFASLTGREYQPFMYHGAKDATDVVVVMCSGADTIESGVDYLIKHDKAKVGVLKVVVYRPFNADAFVKALPKTLKNLTVLDRTKEPGSLGEPLYLDVTTALNEHKMFDINLFAGRFGISGKDFTVGDVVSIYQNMQNKNGKKHFTVGINDDVTHLSLPAPVNYKGLGDLFYEMKFFGLGSDGTVSANKNSIKIIGENTDKFTQAYFEYDSKKSGSVTASHLRIANQKIKAPYFVKDANFIAVHNYAFVHIYDVLEGLKPNGSVLLNTNLNEEQLARDLPDNFKMHLKKSNAKLYIIPANKIAFSLGLKNRINAIMQSAFFKVSNIIDYALAVEQMKKFIFKSYGRKGEAIVNANYAAVDAASQHLIECDVNKIINTKTESFTDNKKVTEYYKKFVLPIEQRKGDDLPVSAFDPTGTVPTATTQYEKRGIAQNVPYWVPEECIQCGQCTLVCPHAVIRPYLLDENEMKNAPASLTTKDAIGIKGMKYRVQISPLDCTGCESCFRTCPKTGKALVMRPLQEVLKEQNENYHYVNENVSAKPTPFKPETVKGAQFLKPYFEFSGACAGCGETPYVKLTTQLFGKNMTIANATGCSSIYGGSSPTCPYTVDKEGKGPSWGNSLFEDAAEFGFGMHLGMQTRRNLAYSDLNKLSTQEVSNELKTIINDLNTNKDTKASNGLVNALKEALANEKSANADVKALLETAKKNIDLFAKKSTWIIGGDGWAYDIGFGGLDHVLASGENINILVLDTEVYSNTGGQASKSTPIGSLAKFASSGKQTSKKDLGLMAMSYKNVYVASVAMGANPQQLINALVEAESYNGPSLIIAYAPCVNHGIDLGSSQAIEKRAVQSGYWNLYRFDPRKEGNELTIDSAEPTIPYSEFVNKENRYVSLMKADPENAAKLFALAEKRAKMRREALVQMTKK